MCNSILFERIFVILHHGSSLVDAVDDARAMRLRELALQANVVDLGRVSSEVLRKVNGQMMDWWKCHDPEMIVKER